MTLNRVPVTFSHSQDPTPEVRQSSLALVGDLAVGCFPQLQPHLAQLLPLIIDNIEPDTESELMSVCNNACWAVGEIALRHGAAFEPFADAVLERTVPLINQPETPRTLRENVAITLGRMGLVLPGKVAPGLEVFAEPWYDGWSFAGANDHLTLPLQVQNTATCP